ncbi:sensor histidine kinase [Brucella intermedia]|uniref:sensor histidine kinase n=1 Tax=Brucella intermedia TaxID=94625 RepID=UPI001591B641|nr:PAS domain-containing protein [Brucella intermedia]
MSDDRQADSNVDSPTFVDENVILRRLPRHLAHGEKPKWPNEIRFSVRTILRSASPMAVLIEPDGSLVFNNAARRVFGARYDQFLGRPVAEAFPDAKDFLEGALGTCRKGKGVRFYGKPVKIVRRGTLETAWFSLSFTPVVDDNRNVLGAMVICAEVSEHVQMMNDVRRSCQRIELALEAGSIVGTWDLDISTGQVTLSSSLAQMLGLPEVPGRRGLKPDILARSVHVEDRERVLAELSRSIEGETEFRCRYRLVTPGSHLHWVVALGRPVRDQGRKLALLSGIIVDVTQMTETSAALGESNLRFDVLAETVPQIVWSTDAFGNHDYFSSRWSEFTGIAQGDITPTVWETLVHPEDWARVDAEWRECLAAGKLYNIDYRFRHRDGTYRWLNVQAKPLRNEYGQTTRWYGTATDIEEAKQLEAQRILVTQEMDHRIKNLFALVNGLVGLTMRDYPALQPLAEPLRARLTALHQAHALVYGGASKAASLHKLIHCLLEPYKTSDPDHIVVSGVDVKLQPSAVTSMALAFHELISNSAKYGSLAHRDGKLIIDVELDKDQLSIRWQGRFIYDQHLAEMRMKQSQSFGTQLLTNVIEGQFRGTFEREFVPEGIDIAISIPASVINDN